MSTLTLSLLGPPRVERDGVPVHISRHKAIALLAYLAVTGQTHRRDALAALLWPEHDQSSARAGLRRALSALREALGEGWLDADRESVGLNRDAEIELDVRAFRQRLAGCEAHSHAPREDCPACLSLLAEAADLYGGDLLAGFTLRDSPGFDDWQFFQTQGLRDELAGALECLVDGHSATGEFEQAIAHARRWLALDPLHEPAHRALMELYAKSDQRAAALRQYEACERILQKELGTFPEQETIALYQAIVEGSGLPEETTGDGRTTARRHNLPAQVTPFVGRETLLAQIGQRLEDPDCRLLTLVGPGGSGKTRLALGAAAQQVDHYAHGVFFVSLAPLDAVEAIVPTIAQALGFPFHGEGEPKEQLLNYLRNKQMLLVLDNYEHLLDGAVLATEILEAAPEVAVIATSRARLSVRGEHRLPIEGMHVPPLPSPTAGRGVGGEGDYSAVKLFLQSARRARPGFELTAENVADVVRICRLVEGMPLGILLAAAWAGTLTLTEIVAEIERSLDFLEVDWRDAPARQHSMRAVFDHSWNLLTEREREVMQALSVFRGGFTRRAAERVAGALLRDLTALVDKSLLHRTAVPSLTLRTGGRYEVHELLRQYAVEKLAALPETERQVRDRHSTYYAAALQQWDTEFKGARQLAALAEIEADVSNARAAWEWAVQQWRVRELDQAMDGLCRFYEWRGRYDEGNAVCRAAGEALGAQTDAALLSFVGNRLRLRAKAAAWRGAFNRALRRLEQAKTLLEESLAQLETLAFTDQDVRQEKAFALWQLGYTLYELGVHKKAQQRYEDSLALYRALGDRWGMASVSYHLGDLLQITDARDQAEVLIHEGLSIQQELGDHRGMAGSLRVLGHIAVSTGSLEESARLARESVDLFQEMGDRAHAAEALITVGHNLGLFLGRLDEAQACLEESVAIYHDLGFSGSSSSLSLAVLGGVEMLLGRYEQAATRTQEALALARAGGYRLGVGVSLYVLGRLALAKDGYDQAYEILQQCYSAIGGTVLEYRTLPFLGLAAYGLGQPNRAGQHLCGALRWFRTGGLASVAVYALLAVALLLVERAEVERAVELYALASRYPYVANSRWFEDVVGKHISAAAAKALPPDVVAAAQERGRARDLDATVKELLAELEDA